MDWLDLTIQGVVCVAACAAGWWAGRFRWAAALAALAVAAISLRLLFRFLPEAEFPLLTSSVYSDIRSQWVYPFAFLNIGIGLYRMRGWVWRAGLGTVGALLLVTALSIPLTRATFHADDYLGAPDAGGICLQTQDYTCGAAASATLLASRGIRTDEAEMARLCGSAPLAGADEIALCRALTHKLDGSGFGVALERPNDDALARRQHPALARVRSTLFRDHWVVLLAINDHAVIVADPLQGKVQLPVEEFLSQWRGILVTVERMPTPAFASR